MNTDSHPKCTGLAGSGVSAERRHSETAESAALCRDAATKTPGFARRDFLRLVGASATAALAFRPWQFAMAGPFTRADFEKLVPADKKLSPEWVKSLTARGEREVYRGADLAKIGMPIGGICAGQLYLGGDGRTLSVVTVVTNRGDGAALGSWSDGWYWSADATWGTNDAYLAASALSGPVLASGSYLRTNTLTVPVGAEGPQYLVVRADNLSGLYESDEANNALALAVTNVPDLVPVMLELTNAAVSSKTLGMVTVVTNQGAGVAAGSWVDYLYLSTDAVWGTNDYQLTTYTQSAAVTNGTSYRRTNSVTLPSCAGGSYYLILRADRNSGLYELADGNTDLAVPVVLTVPDLMVANLIWGGGNPVPGWPLTVVWTVVNAGNGMASPAWSDGVYFSTNSVLDGADTQLRLQSRSQALAVDGSYQVTNTVTIPANAPPSYYLILKSDDQNTIFESNETNNWWAFGVGQYRDADGDGIPDWWEVQYFGSITNCAPNTDPDGDGMPNLFEYLADTNPTNALSVLRLSRIVPETNGVRLEWQGGVAARQFLERSKSLGSAANNWLTLFTNNPPTPLQMNLFDLLGTNRTLFYRVRAVRDRRKCGRRRVETLKS